MEQTWRWWGPDDLITLGEIRQAGASGVVTALHEIPYGKVWPVAAIEKRRDLIAKDASLGLTWSVVESLPVHESIRLGEGRLEPLFEAYRQSLRNLAACGVRTVAYNFMPVLDWTRTDLAWPLPGGGTALRFDAAAFAAFDCLMLEREGAEADHTAAALQRGKAWFSKARKADRERLLKSIMAGLPGAFERYDIPGLKAVLARYKGMNADGLRANLARFLKAVIPTAEEVGIRMAIHPDDPPRPLMGLPRVVSNAADLAFVINAVPSPANGITLCTGSLGAGVGNDLIAIAARFADKIHFAHLRNVVKEPDGSFSEAEHLSGDVDMVAVVAILLNEQGRRRGTGDPRWRIPFRPDHGHALLDDVGKSTHPGYPAIGRLRGLAELRGVITATSAHLGFPA